MRGILHPDQHYGCFTYSQHGEDIFVVNIFTMIGIKKPTYLDIGAHHPVNISNTALLYSRGSRGVNVDANPNVQALFKAHRPNDVNLNIGVVSSYAVDSEQFYLMYDTHSGRNTLSAEEADRFTRESGRAVKSRIEVPLTTVNKIVDDYCHGIFPDFLSIDVEGLDHMILSDLNLDASWPKVICAEVREDESYHVTLTMKAHAYIPLVRMGENIIYLHRTCYDKFGKGIGAFP